MCRVSAVSAQVTAPKEGAIDSNASAASQQLSLCRSMRDTFSVRRHGPDDWGTLAESLQGQWKSMDCDKLLAG